MPRKPIATLAPRRLTDEQARDFLDEMPGKPKRMLGGVKTKVEQHEEAVASLIEKGVLNPDGSWKL